MARVVLVLALALVALVALSSATPSGKRILVLVDNLAVQQSHSLYFADLKRACARPLAHRPFLSLSLRCD